MSTTVPDLISMKGLKIGHYNIRSQKHKFSQMSDLVKLFDIMCISETWLLEAYPDNKLLVPGYKFFRRDRLIEKAGGGLLFYICDKMAPYCSLLTPLSRSEPDIEAVVINFTQPKHRLTSYIHVYRPPNGSYVKCIDSLIALCQDPVLEGRERWLIGDINVDLLQPEDCKTK